MNYKVNGVGHRSQWPRHPSPPRLRRTRAEALLAWAKRSGGAWRRARPPLRAGLTCLPRAARGVAPFLIALAMAAAPAPASAEMVIAKPAVWRESRTVAELVTIESGGGLTLAPGIGIRFEGDGRILCKGSWEARGVEFTAGAAIKGAPRFWFEPRQDIAIRFTDCVLSNLYAQDMNKRYNAFFCLYGGRFEMIRCRVENTSAFLIASADRPVIRDNQFARCGTGHYFGVVLLRCNEALVMNNHFYVGASPGQFLSLYGGQSATVAGNRFHGDGRAAGLMLGNESAFNQVLGNSFFRCREAMRLTDRAVGNRFAGNLLFHFTQYGLYVDQAGSDNAFFYNVFWGAAGATGMIVSASAPITFKNSVLAGCREAVAEKAPGSAARVEFRNNCFWSNACYSAGMLALVRTNGNRMDDPAFIDPEHGDVRLQRRALGHAIDSPLLGAGDPAGVNIGLFP